MSTHGWGVGGQLMIICPSFPVHCVSYLEWLPRQSAQTRLPAVFGASLYPCFKRISHGERERARPARSGTNDEKKGERQMALMAGILFTATSVLLGISTCVSSARIYPPNEGKTGNNSGAPFWTFSPLVYTPSTSCVRRTTSPVSRSYSGLVQGPSALK